MAAPDFSDISKPLDGRIGVPRVAAVMPLPAYGDLSKAANDVSCAIDPPPTRATRTDRHASSLSTRTSTTPRLACRTPQGYRKKIRANSATQPTLRSSSRLPMAPTSPSRASRPSTVPPLPLCVVLVCLYPATRLTKLTARGQIHSQAPGYALLANEPPLLPAACLCAPVAVPDDRQRSCCSEGRHRHP
jgi:hypothetical protein